MNIEGEEVWFEELLPVPLFGYMDDHDGDHHVCLSLYLVLWWRSSHLRWRQECSPSLSSASFNISFNLWSLPSKDTVGRRCLSCHHLLSWWYTIYSIDFLPPQTHFSRCEWITSQLQQLNQNNCGRTRHAQEYKKETVSQILVSRLQRVLLSR